LLGAAITDLDGFYKYPYKHTGKAATFTVRLPAYNKSETVIMKANSFVYVNFELP
jgi:hypothetical protein